MALALVGTAMMIVTAGDDRDTDAVVAGPGEEATPAPVGDPAFEVLLAITTEQPPATLAAATDDASLAELWSDLAVTAPHVLDASAGPPAIDLDRRIVVTVAVDAEQLLCGTIEITSMSRFGSVVTPRFERTEAGACGFLEGVSQVYVVAVDRQAVQPGFTLASVDLAEPTAPPASTLEVTVPRVESTAVRFRTVTSFRGGPGAGLPSTVPIDGTDSVVAAQRPDQLAALQASLANLRTDEGPALPDPPPDELTLVDLGREIVVAFTVASGGCPPFVDGLGDDPGALRPRYLSVPGRVCPSDAYPYTYILAVERASVPDGFTFELEADDQFPARSLRVEAAPPVEGASTEDVPAAAMPDAPATELLVVASSDTPAGALVAAVDDDQLAELWATVATAGLDEVGLGGIAAGVPPPAVDLSRRVVVAFTVAYACRAVAYVGLVADGARLRPEPVIDPGAQPECAGPSPPSLTYVIAVDRRSLAPGVTLAPPAGTPGDPIDVEVPSVDADGVRFRTVVAPFAAFDGAPRFVSADPTGSLRAAGTAEQLTELLGSLGLGDQRPPEGEAVSTGRPIPPIDLDTEVVVAFTVQTGCSTFVARLDGVAGSGGNLVPRLADVRGQACRAALFAHTFVLAVERASVPDGFTLELPPDEQHPAARSLRVAVPPD